MGKLTPTDGGYELTGRWSFSSGCDHCSWVLLGALVVGPEGKPVDFLTVLIPRRDYTIADVWDVMGLCGTGSNDIVIEKAFVPTHRGLSFNDVSALKCPGQEVNTSGLYKLPFGTIFSNTITAPIIGMAQGAYDAHVETMRERVRVSYGGQKVAQDPFAHVRVARAASDIDAAWLQLIGNTREVDAVDLLFKNSGGRSLKSGNPIERAWRDAHAGSVHAANDTERWLAMYGKGAFGLEIEDAMI
jgi:3-hydroxy-9,10-secoandrosta-1,3,5(10)-triene-9,17-dione monooxygenase